MTRDNRNRWIIYLATAASCIALLGYSFAYQGEPDECTLLSGADCLIKVGAIDQAIVECEKVLERDPGNFQAHLLLGNALDRLGRTREAIEDYRRAIGELGALAADALLPEDRRRLSLEIRLAIADLERRVGDFDQAVGDSRVIDAEFGPTSRAALVRGYAHEACGETTSAGEAFADAVALGPSEPIAQWAFGCFCLDHGRAEDALVAFERVHALDSGQHPAYPTPYRIAQARAALSDRDGAIAALHEAVRSWRGFVKQNLLDDPAFASLRGEPDFDALVAELVGGRSSRS
jgi:tetratricopeptide (TPR) repeat protein